MPDPVYITDAAYYKGCLVVMSPVIISILWLIVDSISKAGK